MKRGDGKQRILPKNYSAVYAASNEKTDLI
jgi:hypothetical protein